MVGLCVRRKLICLVRRRLIWPSLVFWLVLFKLSLPSHSRLKLLFYYVNLTFQFWKLLNQWISSHSKALSTFNQTPTMHWGYSLTWASLPRPWHEPAQQVRAAIWSCHHGEVFLQQGDWMWMRGRGRWRRKVLWRWPLQVVLYLWKDPASVTVGWLWGIPACCLVVSFIAPGNQNTN